MTKFSNFVKIKEWKPKWSETEVWKIRFSDSHLIRARNNNRVSHISYATNVDASV